MVVYLSDYIIFKGQVINDDDELNIVFQDAKKLTGSNFIIQNYTISTRRFLKITEERFYNLYEPAGENTGEWSIAHHGTRATLLAYLNGIVDGLTYYR